MYGASKKLEQMRDEGMDLEDPQFQSTVRSLLDEINECQESLDGFMDPDVRKARAEIDKAIRDNQEEQERNDQRQVQREEEEEEPAATCCGGCKLV